MLRDWAFDRQRFHISAGAFASTDVAHWLALEVADDALRDAGLLDVSDEERERIAVVIGNTLTGDQSRASVMRLRWPYVARVVDAALRDGGMEDAMRRALLVRMEPHYKAPFPAVDENTLAGALANTIAGRICNMYGFGAGGYSVDAACASSLQSVANACSLLELRAADVVVAGGVDVSLDPFELIGFAKTSALASGEMFVYDRRANGFLPGEGCGIVVLMRAADARASGRRIYATIRGWGISSDGRAPRLLRRRRASSPKTRARCSSASRPILHSSLTGSPMHAPHARRASACCFPGKARPCCVTPPVPGSTAFRRSVSTSCGTTRASPMRRAEGGPPLAQPAIITASLAALRLLAHLGIGASAVAGHSLGELTALHWAVARRRA